jgi:diguanylate cyclase (GGDEF)-like protein
MPDETVSILLVEDNPGDVRLFKEALKEAYASRFELVHCQSLGRALDCLAQANPNVIVVDLGLPDASGLEVVKKMRAAALTVPVVVLTSRADETMGLQALHDGAQDYLIKGELDGNLLSRALRYAIERHRMQEALRNESLIDELTNLYNRRGFLTLAGNHLKLAERMHSTFSLVFIDLDGMKQINDSFGHLAGDRALVETADLLGRCVRQSDIVARLGGDEFVLLLTTVTDDTEAAIRRRLQEQLDYLNTQSDRQYALSFSVGIVTTVADDSVTLEALLKEADSLMYRQKQDRKEQEARK